MMLEDEADEEEADENDDAADRVSCCDTVIQSEEDENENQEGSEWQQQQQRCGNRSSCYTSELVTTDGQSTPSARERAGGQFSCSIFANKSPSGGSNFGQAKDNNREDEEEAVPRSSGERRKSKDRNFVGDTQESNSRDSAASSGSCGDGGGVFEFLDGRGEREFGADFKGIPVSGLKYDNFGSDSEADQKQDSKRNAGHSKKFKSDCDSCGSGTSPRQNDRMRQQSFQLSSRRGSPLGVDEVSMANKQLQHRVPSSRLATTTCTTTSDYEMVANNSGASSYKANQTGGAHIGTSAGRGDYQLGTSSGFATSLVELHQASITVACPGVDATADDDDNDEQREQEDDEQNAGDDDELDEQTSIGSEQVAASYTDTTATTSGGDGSHSNGYLRLASLSDCEARYYCRPTSSASSSSPSPSSVATIGLAGGDSGQGQLITRRQESRGQSATSTTGHQRAAPNQVFACDTARNSNPTSNGNSTQVVVDVGTSLHCNPDATRRQPLCRRTWQPQIQQQQLEFGASEQQHPPHNNSRMLPVAQQQHYLSNHHHTSGSGGGEQQQQQGQPRATFASFAGGGGIEHAPGDGRVASSCASSSSPSWRNKIFERDYEIHIIHPVPAPRQQAIESLANQSSSGIDNNKEKWYKCSTSSTNTNTSDATARLASACIEKVNKQDSGGNPDSKTIRQETNSTRDAARTGNATATTGQEYRLTMMIDQSTTTTTSMKQKTTTITPTETMTENLKQYPPNHPLGNSKHLCAICGDRATGKHYGVFSCEGCKGFFKRTIRKDIVYVCRAQGCCLIDMRQRNRCQYCRYQKCLTCGMKREAVQEEKQRLKLRAAAAGQQQQSQLQQQQQQQQHQISSDTSNNQNQNHIFNQCDTSADLSQNKLDSSTSTPHYNHYNLETTHNNDNNHHHHHHHSHQLGSSGSSPPSSYSNNCNTSPHTFNSTTTTANSHNYDHHPLGSTAIYQQSGFGFGFGFGFGSSSSIAAAVTTNLRPGMRINELTLKWAAQVQIECLIDWAKSVPKFTGLLIDDQVTLLKAYWNELIIAHIAFKTAEALRDGSMPGAGHHDKLNNLCIGRGIFINANQAHEIGLGNMFDRIIDELVVKMRDMRIDNNELACLRAIILFNPESHGLKTSQPIEEYRGDIYTTLETYCRRHYENQPNRFGKLLLRLPALRSIGLKCDSMRPYQQQRRRCDNNNINHHHLVTTSTSHYNNSHHQVPRCSPTGGRGSSSPTSSSVSSISSSTSTTSSNGMTTTSSIITTTGAGAVPESYKFGHQVNLLFFGLCYEMSSIDSFLRESLTLN